MRLHTIEFEAFGPYARKQTVDMERLNQSGLFVLEGPTGAGKSTVLDAITFALYGSLAGSDSGKDRLRSDFAGDAEPYVQLEFSVRGTRWRVRRTPTYDRPKRDGSGTTRVNTSAHLQRWEEGRWASVAQSASEAGTIIGQQVGLTRDQFTQVVLLPQGEFATFLRSKDRDRREVLTKIFGTHLYDAITDDLLDRRKTMRGQVDAATNALRETLAAALEAAGSDERTTDGLLGLRPQERSSTLDAVVDELASARRGADAAVADATPLVDEAAKAERQAVELDRRMHQYLRARQELTDHQARSEQIDSVKESLEQARKAEPVRPFLAEVATAEAAVNDAQDVLRAVLADLPDEGWGERDADEARAEAGLNDELAATLEHAATLEKGLPALRTKVAALDKAVADVDADVALAQSRARKLPEELRRAQDQVAEAQRLASQADGSRQKLDALRERLTAAAQADALAPKVVEAERLFAQAQDEQRSAVDRHQDLLQQRLDGIAAELAGALSDGTPCPVCGSTDHPAPAQSAAGAVREEDVERAHQRRQVAEQATLRAREAAEQLRTQQATLLAVAGDESTATLTTLVDEASADLDIRTAAAERLDGLVAARTKLEAERETLDTDLQRLQAARATKVTERDGAERDLGDREAAVIDARGGYETVGGRQTALRALSTGLSDAAKRLDDHANAVVNRDQRVRAAEKQADRQGFASPEEAERALRSEEERTTLADKVATWHDRLIELNASVARPEYGGLDGADPAELAASAQDAGRRHIEAKAVLATRTSALATARERENRFAERRTEVGRAEANLAATRAKADPVERLAALANGSHGHRRMALTTYVLRQWFSRVVDAANLRLDRMSGSRYQLERSEEGERRNDAVGLGLRVVDRYTGRSRSPKSLSGGETFYTSLALALGLADVVRAEGSGAELDTIFIDEGFGSLDAETLEQVMGVIDELRDGNRTVGIVSHVADLKERIAERIEVRRPDEAGPSELRVIA